MLSPDDLAVAAMRAALNSSLPDAGTILRPSIVNSGLGPATTWGTVAILPCRISPIQRTPFEGIQQAAITSVEDRQVTFAAGADVQVTDRVLVSGSTIDITGVPTPRSYEISLRAQGKIVR